MPKRRLGRSDLEASAIGLGCMGMSFAYGTPPDRGEMVKLLRAAVDRRAHARAAAAYVQGARCPEELEKRTGL